MTDRLGALLAKTPGLARASRLEAQRLPVLDALTDLLPDRGLRHGTTTSVTGIGATSLALALIARASQQSWVACVGAPSIGLHAASELGVDLGHLVVVSDPGKQWTDVLAALVDAFDVVVTAPVPARMAPKLSGRVRERDAVLVSIGAWPGSDLAMQTTAPVWHGLGDGHGHLQARTIDVTTTGRRSASRAHRATLWLPDADGEVSLVERGQIVRLAT